MNRRFYPREWYIVAPFARLLAISKHRVSLRFVRLPISLVERLYTPTCVRTSPFVACPRAIQFVTNLYFTYEPTYQRCKYGKEARDAFLPPCALERNVVWVDNDFGLVTMLRNEIHVEFRSFKLIRD